MSSESYTQFTQYLDSQFESEVARSPQSIRTWMAYIQTQNSTPFEFKCWLFERALSHLPRCFKLWKRYLDLLLAIDSSQDITSHFARCLTFCFLYPRLWLMYLGYLVSRRQFRACREVFNAALRNLPLPQHGRLWKWCLEEFVAVAPPATGRVLLRRYLQFEPAHGQVYLAYLVRQQSYSLALAFLRDLIFEEVLVIPVAKTKLVAEYISLAKKLLAVSPELKSTSATLPFLASLVPEFPDQFAVLQSGLAECLVAAGDFSGASAVYEAALTVAPSLVQFSQVFDAYAKFLESLVSVFLARGDERNAESTLATLEQLTGDRKSQLMLQYSPQSVAVWLERLATLPDDQKEAHFQKALASVDVGTSELVRTYVEWLWESGRQADGRLVLETATISDKHRWSEVADLWIFWIDLETEDRKLQVARTAATRMAGNLKVWRKVVETEKKFGTSESVKCAYQTAVDRKLADFQMILEYAEIADDPFPVFERGIGNFRGRKISDHTAAGLLQVYVVYLHKATQRMIGNGRYFRLQDLFLSCLDFVRTAVPGKLAESSKAVMTIFCMYANFEATEGFLPKAIAALEQLLEIQKFPIATFRLLVSRTWLWTGGDAETTRDVFERNLAKMKTRESLVSLTHALIDFAEFEVSMGQIARARQIFGSTAEIPDIPEDERNCVFQAWKKFEVVHGSEATFKQLKKIEKTTTTTAPSEIAIPPTLPLVAEIMQEANVEFEASESFAGSRTGFVFYKGDRGLGYYRDWMVGNF